MVSGALTLDAIDTATQFWPLKGLVKEELTEARLGFNPGPRQ